MRSRVKPYGIFLIGLFVAAFGVALSAKAGLGTSPVSALPYSLSLVNSRLSFGGWLNLLSVIQILVQVLLLRRRCKPVDVIIATVLAFVYGYLTDFCSSLLRNLPVGSYAVQFAYMLASCFIVGLGIWIQLKGGVAMLPGEMMNRAISAVTGKRYENVKIFFDILYIALGAAVSLIAIGKLAGVREGSILAAILIGNIIKLYNRLFVRDIH